MMGHFVWGDIFGQVKNPRFGVRLYNGETRFYGEGTMPVFTIHIKTPHASQRLLGEGSLGFGESFMDGSTEIEGDLSQYLRLRHTVKLKPTLRVIAASAVAKFFNKERREEQIAFHYDTGNEFFSHFLDEETMSYSAGCYGGELLSLSAAQKRKFTFITDLLSLPKNARVLDMGSGWGGFANHAAKEHGLIVDGETLSKNQLVYAEELAVRAGAQNRVKFSYRDFTLPRENVEHYDGAVMIEALEHVGKGNLPLFFQNTAASLRSGAPFYVQFTGRYKPKTVDRWTLKYVFPGGHLPSKDEFLCSATKAGFAIEQFEDNTADYIKTLAEWIRGFEGNRESITKLYGESEYRRWKLFLYGARVNFEVGDMSLCRALLRKP